MTDRSFLLGIDIGGTFTDVVLTDPSGLALETLKVLTTPADPSVGVLDGVQQLLARTGVQPADVARVVHATTLATNLVLEGAGAEVAFVTTAGFGDVPRIGRESRYGTAQYDLFFDKPQPPVAPDLVFEVDERMSASGEVVRPLDPASLDRACAQLAAREPAAVAISLLNSYSNPVHEQLVVDAVRAAVPRAHVAASILVWPEYREYDRAMTTIASAYVGPVLSVYLEGLQAKLAARGIDVPVQVMQSNGGIVSAAHAAARAVYAVESGPAAGVVAANWAGRLCGERNIIAFDMGGTTAKAGLVRDGEPTITHEFRIGGAGSMSSAGGASGFPIQIPVIDLAEVGSGGGSIAWVDPGGALQVGPRSAGADPGPACYDRGGEEPTVTDADLVLGYLNPEYFVGGEMKLSVDRARDAIERVGRELGIDLLDVAVGVHDIATANMATAIRQVTIQRGIDPREFAAVASGGSGPVHIVRVAHDFGIPRIIIPRAAGVMSAVGLVTSDIVIDLVRSKVLPLADADGRVIAEVFADLERRGVEELAGDGVDPAAITIRRSVEVRYQHQAYGIDIPVDSQDLTREVLDALPDAFFEAYRQQYGIDWRGPTEIVNVRARFIGDVQKLHATPRPLPGGTEAATTAAHRPAYFAEHRGFVETPVYNRDLLSPGQHVHGPAIVEERNSTVVIPPAYRAAVDAHANLVIERVAAPSQS